MKIRMQTLTPRGREMIRWTRHWEFASKIADRAVRGSLTPEARKEEQAVLRLVRRMVAAKYRRRVKFE